jgi:hypothetical protein
LPYTFDISIFTQIDNDDLIKHILRVGKTFYLKENEKLKTIYSVKSLKFKKYTIQLSKIIFLLGLTTWA